MRKQAIKIFFMTFLVLAISTAYASAYTITLDGVENAGLWSEDKTRTYLYVWNVNDSSYYYQWQYDGSTPLPWSSLDALVADLNTTGFDWWLESGGDPFNSPEKEIWTSLYIPGGYYDINLAADSSAYNLLAYWGGDMWNAYVQLSTEGGDSYNFGEGFPTFDSENEALTYYYSDVDGLSLYLQEDTNVFFYINDTNSVDNSGSVSLEITHASHPVPEPSTVLLLGTGIAALFLWHTRQPRRKKAVQPL